MGTVARKAVLVVVALAAATGGAGLVLRAPSAGAIPAPVHVVVPGTAGGDGHGGIPPVATGVVLGPLDAVVITATGTVNLSAGGSAPPILNGPNGGNPPFFGGWNSLIPNGYYGCLGARVGAGPWRCVGAGPTLLTGTGEVFLAVNDGLTGGDGYPGYLGNSGHFDATIVPKTTDRSQADVPGTAGGDGYGGTPPVATGVVLGPDNAVSITATGTVNLSAGGSAPPILNGPDGGNPAFPSAPGGSLVSLGRFGCLAARIGSGGWRCIGAGPTVLTGIGEVFLGVNDGFFGGNIPGYQGNSGQFAVTLAVGSTYPPDMPAPTFRSSASSRHRR